MAIPTGTSRVIIFSFCGNLIVAIARFACYVVTRSPSMMAATIHSIGDTVNQFLLLLSLKKGQIGPSHRFSMAQGRESYLFSLMTATGIMLGALYTLHHGILLLGMEEEPIQFSQPSIIVLIASLLFQIILLRRAFKGVWADKAGISFAQYINESDDPSILGALFGSITAVLSTTMALLGVYCSYKFQTSFPDILATIMIGSLLLIMSIYFSFINYRLIVGTELPGREMKKISDFINQRTEVEKIEVIASEVLAPSKVQLSIEIKFAGHHIANQFELRRALHKLLHRGVKPKNLKVADDQTISQLSDQINALKKDIRKHFPELILIDIEPN